MSELPSSEDLDLYPTSDAPPTPLHPQLRRATKLLRYFPPLVVGISITLIGINLLPSGIGLIFGQDSSSPDYGDSKDILLAAICVALVIMLYRLLPKQWTQMAILLAMLCGTVIALFMGKMDVSEVAGGPVIAPPEIFFWGPPQFNLVAIMSMMVIWLVMMIESVGQLVAVGKVVGRRATPSSIAGALRTDGLMSALGGVFQSFGYITFTQNVGVVSLTGVRSRFVTVAAGMILVVLSVFPALGRFVSVIPDAVLGGVTLVMFATVAIIGIQILATIDFDRMGNLVAAALSLGVGVIPVLAPEAYDGFPEQLRMFLDSGVAVGAVTVIFLNLLFNHWVRDRPQLDTSDPFAVASADSPVHTEAER